MSLFILNVMRKKLEKQLLPFRHQPESCTKNCMDKKAGYLIGIGE